MYRILQKDRLHETVERMVIHAPFVARKCEPGQFVMVRIEEGGERIPLTIADYDREKESVTIIYQVVGYSTRLLAEKEEGDFISDFAGPLGRPVDLEPKKRVLGIGGGVGAAPLYPQIRRMKELGAEVDVILGGRTHSFIILEEEFRAFSGEVLLATNDGSAGTKGFVTDVLKQLLAEGREYDEVICIGPLPMMKAVVDITKEKGIPTGVSLNPIMIDGTGMCGGCRVTVGGETMFACVDGPDFDGLLVDFDECIRRQGMYKDMEEHICLIGREG
ncbi:sulfide/dihydroorotate dehydrogenase-like FAD/NAD-binding protein [Gorillibacterium sp. CAU 1737]|uniref:sulfide/dihydroorotate dehydrogenase-like FAD/NAD-binding protein n=1 Tax=Gorillibacterium sp. CAU 1737 TaxID=3140362 RepID=UPI0032616FCC